MSKYGPRLVKTQLKTDEISQMYFLQDNSVSLTEKMYSQNTVMCSLFSIL